MYFSQSNFRKKKELLQLESLRALAGQLLTIQNSPFEIYDDIYRKGMEFVQAQHKLVYVNVVDNWIKKKFSLEMIMQQKTDYIFIDNSVYTLDFKKIKSMQIVDNLEGHILDRLYLLIIWFEKNKTNTVWLEEGVEKNFKSL